MAQSINKVMLLGNLGADPEFRTFDNGDRICNLSVATNTSWREPHGEAWHERTEWHRVTVKSSNLVALCERKARKGSTVFIEGSLETRSWSDSMGNKRWTTEVILRPFRSELKVVGNPKQIKWQAPGPTAEVPSIQINDDIPF